MLSLTCVAPKAAGELAARRVRGVVEDEAAAGAAGRPAVEAELPPEISAIAACIFIASAKASGFITLQAIFLHTHAHSRTSQHTQHTVFGSLARTEGRR